MKEIKAFVKPFKVNDICHHLIEAGFPNLSVSTAEGTGNLENADPSVSTQFSITDSKVAKIEIVCTKNDVDQIVAIISEQGRTGNPGDGIIYVSDVEKIYRVKTGLPNGN
ncbi:P-II family nitrogen regulator [Gaoshiqia sp. Z1-71]|uniref:P-II family nitrogen regulator n=1 Tax=Gaoshiqia hydrogeniformans TaxID=3290090 RepID=UPI003BF901B2